LPKEKLPVLIWIFVGAFRMGDKGSGMLPLLPFAQRGYVCAAIEYRYSSEALFPVQVHDCKCAIR
jgi:acetyl esterase/lipase